MVPWKRSYLNIYNLSLFLSCIFKVTNVFFSTIKKNFIYGGNNGPLTNVIFSALHFKHSQSNWIIKFIELTKCLQNFRFNRTIISDYSSNVKLKFKKYLSAHDLHVIFRDCATWSVSYTHLTLPTICSV